jgi:aspartate-semialdehyde dehydrogenase
MSINIAVVGATGNVGREMLNILSEKNYDAKKIFPVASERSAGSKIEYGSTELTVEAIEKFDISKVQVALFSAGSEVSKEWAPKFVEKDCVVIDNSSQFRMDDDIPLIVPEVNPEDIKDFKKRNIIANPNCSTIQLVVALKPLHEISKIKKVIVSTYQSVSGAGKAAMDELFDQTKNVFSDQIKDNINFTKPIAFNVIPHIGDFIDDGYTKEEIKMREETNKILDKGIQFSATCVRVPVFIGHAESVNIEFENKVSVDEARNAIKNAPGCSLLDERKDGGYVTPKECAGNDDTYVSRIREDSAVENGLSIWVVSDNLRKGAALNTIQIAEKLMEKYLNP